VLPVEFARKSQRSRLIAHRPHSSLGRRTPDEVYFTQPTEKAA